MNRDEQLDNYRALSMIYIICVIHVLYWQSYGCETIRSLALVEMPVIFFIAGAALSKTNIEQRKFSQVFGNRFKRVMLPYYIYIAITVLLAAAISLLFSHNLFGKLNIFKILIGYGLSEINLKYYHIWFISVYFVISISFPLQLKAMRSLGKSVYYFILICLTLGIIVAAGTFPKHQFNEVQYFGIILLGYNLFYISGFVFYKKLSFKTILILSVILVLTFFVITHGDFHDMQSHKFPPDIVFISYGALALALFGCIFSWVKIPSNRITRWWNKNGYTLYLYQNLIFLAVDFGDIILAKNGLSYQHTFLAGVATSVIVFIGSSILSLVTVRIEKAVISRLPKHWFTKRKSAIDI